MHARRRWQQLSRSLARVAAVMDGALLSPALGAAAGTAGATQAGAAAGRLRGGCAALPNLGAGRAKQLHWAAMGQALPWATTKPALLRLLCNLVLSPLRVQSCFFFVQAGWKWTTCMMQSTWVE